MEKSIKGPAPTRTPMMLDDWRALDMPDPPADFNWDMVCKRYVKKVIAIREESEALRKAFDSENLKKIAGGGTGEISESTPGAADSIRAGDY